MLALFDSAASVAAAFGIPFGLYQLWLSRRQARASFEQEFVNRYWAIEDDRFRDDAPKEVHRSRYLRLCEDEFELMRLGQISWRTWEIWHDGIGAGLRAMRVEKRDSITRNFHWISVCAGSGNHRGVDCPAIFALDRHNPHAAFRMRGSLPRTGVRAGNAMRRVLYGRLHARSDRDLAEAGQDRALVGRSR